MTDPQDELPPPIEADEDISGYFEKGQNLDGLETR